MPCFLVHSFNRLAYVVGNVKCFLKFANLVLQINAKVL